MNDFYKPRCMSLKGGILEIPSLLSSWRGVVSLF